MNLPAHRGPAHFPRAGPLLCRSGGPQSYAEAVADDGYEQAVWRLREHEAEVHAFANEAQHRGQGVGAAWAEVLKLAASLAPGEHDAPGAG